MSDNSRNWLVVVGGGIVVGVLLVIVAGIVLILAGQLGGLGRAREFGSNGAQIYFTGTSRRGTPITADTGPGMEWMRGTRMSCTSCHGPDGRGGDVRIMMRVVEVPDIRYETLTSEDHGTEGDASEEEHAPYDEESIKRAITGGVEPDGEPLE